MMSQKNYLFCRLDGLTPKQRDQERATAIVQLGLLQTESVPVFEEATQAAAQALEAPVCLLSIMESQRQRFKSAVGLSRLGLMNSLATSRQLERLEGFCAYVVDSHQPLVVANALEHPALAASLLVHQYGVRAYLGVPLITSQGICIGTLAIMDVAPRQFSQRDVAFLQLMARWSISEYERQSISPKSRPSLMLEQDDPDRLESAMGTQLRVGLLSQMAQELRTPLTSVMGMASVLTREIYGPLTLKQREYLNIIHNSSQYLLSLMNEILELSELKEDSHLLNLASVDVEMLCQQAMNTLEQAAQRREMQLRVTMEPGRRIWLMDKDKVRQMLYHLAFSVIQSSTAGSIVRLHISRREANLNLSIWVSHPWLGEGLTYAEVAAEPALVGATVGHDDFASDVDLDHATRKLALIEPHASRADIAETPKPKEAPRKNLGLLLSQHLAELHGGHISVQGVAESGYRYVICLPQIDDGNAE
jgi:signal transduction histidine kinase